MASPPTKHTTQLSARPASNLADNRAPRLAIGRASPCVEPSLINGDLPMSRTQRAEYMRYHAERNAANAQRSRDEGVTTRPIPRGVTKVSAPSSPARVSASHFFEHASRELSPYFAHRPITMLDLGCGRGEAALPFFAAIGLSGHYIGVDITKHANWSDRPVAGFTKQLVLADIHRLDLAALPPIDLLVSCTSLEHVRDDHAAIERLSAHLAPGAAQAHFVPGEAALPLYQTHGWRQYSPRCLRDLFPNAELFRAGGPFSSELHWRAFTTIDPSNNWYANMPALYYSLREITMRIDSLLGSSEPTMYGALIRPEHAIISRVRSSVPARPWRRAA